MRGLFLRDNSCRCRCPCTCSCYSYTCIYKVYIRYLLTLLSLSLCIFAAVRFGRVPKREKARILAAMQQSTQNRGQQRALATELDDQPRLLAAVLRAHLETCEFTKEKVSAMRQRARECPSYSMPTLLVSKLNLNSHAPILV